MTGNKITTIAFDADDTLWQNEKYFVETQDRFVTLLADHIGRDDLMERLLATERRNLPRYGFGIKGFTLSMVETALDVTDNGLPGSTVAELIAVGREMLSHPVELLPHAAETVAALSERHQVLLITKGDLMDQERKLAASDLRDAFDGVEIVSAKTRDTYLRIFEQRGNGAAQGLMVGNSMRSDVVPMIQAGGWGIHVPHGLEWAIEHAAAPSHHPRYAEIGHLGQLPGLVEDLQN